MSISQRGLFGKYILAKSDGSSLDPQAEYFVVRYDASAAHGYAGRAALLEYAAQVQEDCPELARDLLGKLRNAPEQEIRVRANFILPYYVVPPGTDLMRHSLTVTVLHDRSVFDFEGIGLSALNSEDVVYEVEWDKSEELTHQEMAQALRDAGSEPQTLLGEDAWKYELSEGDEVTAECIKGTIQNIVFSRDGETAAILFKDGTLVNCPVEEIS